MLAINDITQHMNALCVQLPLHAIHDEQEYDEAVSALNELLDSGGADENHPLAVLVAMLGDFIADYEAKHDVKQPLSGREMLAFLMTQHEVKQSELPEVGSQGVVSEVLSGKRELTTKHIKALAGRFGVPAAVFLGA